MSERSNRLSAKVDAAFHAAATAVIERARQTGTPVIIWQNGQIKEIPSEEFVKLEQQLMMKKSAS